MNILYLCADPGIRLDDGLGAAVHVWAMTRAFAALGNHVTLVATSVGLAPPPTADVFVKSVPLGPLNQRLARTLRRVSAMRRGRVRYHPDVVRYLHNYAFARAGRDLGLRAGADAVYARYSLWDCASVWVARRLRVPLVLEVNAPLAYEQARYRQLRCPALANRVEQRVWRAADLIIAVDDGLRPLLARAGVGSGRVRVLPNAVDTELFHPDVKPDAVRDRHGLRGRFVVGFVGSFKAWHGVEVLIDAFIELHLGNRDTHLLLVGDGPLLERLRRKVSDAGVAGAVTFTGRVPHHEAPEYVAAMDVTVAPYPALEHFYYSPLKVFEYMAAGRPVVTSRVGRLARLLEDGETALLCPPGDRRELLACLRRLRADVSLARKVATRARVVAQRHTWNQNAARVIAWIEELRDGRVQRSREPAEWTVGGGR